MGVEDKKFKGYLVVATAGPVVNPAFGVTVSGVQQLGLMSDKLRRYIPDDNKMLLVYGDSAEIKESAMYFRVLGRGIGRQVLMPELSNDCGHDDALAEAIMAGLLVNEVHSFGVLVVVATNMMSAWLTKAIHDKGKQQLQLGDACAYLTTPEGLVYAASSSRVVKI